MVCYFRAVKQCILKTHSYTHWPYNWYVRVCVWVCIFVWWLFLYRVHQKSSDEGNVRVIKYFYKTVLFLIEFWCHLLPLLFLSIWRVTIPEENLAKINFQTRPRSVALQYYYIITKLTLKPLAKGVNNILQRYYRQ